MTLAAFCLAHSLDKHKAAEDELARIWTKVEKIRAKQAAKPTGSALPVAVPMPVRGEITGEKPEPKCEPTNRHHMTCKNMKEVGGGMEGERYRCEVCGESYFLDYDDMR